MQGAKETYSKDSENTKSGGEAGPAHSQQQEDGGVSHFVRIHSCSNYLHFLSSPPSFTYLPLSLPEINHASHDHHMTPLSQEYAELQERYVALQETVSDQEIALVEMGKKLSV